MRAWHGAGFLPAELKVRLDTETDFVAIKDRQPPFAFTQPAAAAAVAAPADSAAESEQSEEATPSFVSDEEKQWFYKDKEVC
jgi:hypothetical protein